MKIGIVTYHRSHNYGAIMQAIATRVYLQNQGHDVYYVDYWPEYHSQRYKVYSASYIKRFSMLGKIKYLAHQTFNYPQITKRINVFESFIAQYITPYCKSMDDSFDVVIYGSDQIWRKQSSMGGRYNPVYFGENNIKTKANIAYAASMGVLPNKEVDLCTLKKLLANLNDISVRESELNELVNKLGYKSIQVVDPTLLLSKDDWMRIIPYKSGDAQKPYVLFYDLNAGSFDCKHIEEFACKHGWEVKTIVGFVTKRPSPNTYPYANPADFMNLIRGAQFVFTSSFHGMVFSIINEIPFYASFHSNSGRAKSLLSLLNLENRLLDPMSPIPDIVAIDYKNVTEWVKRLKMPSINYIAETLNKYE